MNSIKMIRMMDRRHYFLFVLLVTTICTDRVSIDCLAQKDGLELADEIRQLIDTIDHNPDRLHIELTPSVLRLVEIGEPAIPFVLELMLIGDDEKENELREQALKDRGVVYTPATIGTRVRAKTVLTLVTAKMFGFERGKGWSKMGLGQEAFEKFWESLGSLDSHAPREERQKAVRLWHEWLMKRDGNFTF